MSDRRPNRRNAGRAPRGGPQPASVAAHFSDVGKVRAFFVKLGMPDSLVRQLAAWVEGLVPGGAMERMEPELTWEGQDVHLLIDAVMDHDEEVDVEFTGPPTLIEALQADLDDTFGSKGRPS